jgi:hypothetical protein
MGAQDEITIMEAVTLLQQHGVTVDRRTVLRAYRRGEIKGRQLPGGPKMPVLLKRSSVIALANKKRGQS